MKKIIFKRLLCSVCVIGISLFFLVPFISLQSEYPYEKFVLRVFIPLFSLVIVYRVAYDIFFFLSLGKNSEQIENSKAVTEFFPAWQKKAVNISKIFILAAFFIMILWFGFSFIVSSSYEKGVDKLLSAESFLNCDPPHNGTYTETISDFTSLYPMISYSSNGEYNCEDQNAHINLTILEGLPNRAIDSQYENDLNDTGKLSIVVYSQSEKRNIVLKKVKTPVPFEKDGLTGYYTVEKFAGEGETQESNSTEIAVKAKGVYVKLNLWFSDEEDFSRLDIDKAVSTVCALGNAARSHTLYSLKTAFADFYAQYGSGN